MTEAKKETLLHLVTKVASRIPSPALETLCTELETMPSGSTMARVAQSGSVSEPLARRYFGELVSEWVAVHGDSAGPSLAWALRGASAADEWWRSSRVLELVWTGPTPPSSVLRRTEQALLEVIESSRKKLWLVSFVGYNIPSLRGALQRAGERGVDIEMIIEDPEVSRGKITHSKLQALGASLAEHATVYVWPITKRETNEKGDHGSLHVKCTLADEELLFVTSANLTGHAMNLNMELGLLVRGGAQPKRLADHLSWLIRSGTLVRAD